MSDAPEIHSRRGPDGSTEVWVDGWHLCFQDGGEPDSPTPGHAPPDAESGPGEAEIEITAERIAVRRGGWIALIREGKAEMVPAKPLTPDLGGFFLGRLRRRRA